MKRFDQNDIGLLGRLLINAQSDAYGIQFNHGEVG